MRTYQLSSASRNDLELQAEQACQKRNGREGKKSKLNWLLQQVIHITHGIFSHTQSGLCSNPFITWSFPEFISCVPSETTQAEMDDLICK